MRVRGLNARPGREVRVRQGRPTGGLAMLSPALRTLVRYGIQNLQFFICRKDGADANRLFVLYSLG